MRALERHILLLTADKNLASALRPTLEAHGWTASWLEDFAAATAMLRGGGAGMVIADLGAGDDAFLRARYVELAAECRKAGAPVIALGELADSSVNFLVRPWAKSGDYWALKWDITEAVKLKFDEAGISIPYPQMDVHLEREDAAQEDADDKA